MLVNMGDKNNFEKSLAQLATDLKAMRLNAGLSQEALALAANVNRTYVSQLERGVANPSLQILYRIADVLQLKIRIKFEQASSK